MKTKPNNFWKRQLSISIAIILTLTSVNRVVAQNLFVSEGGWILEFTPAGSYSTYGNVLGNRAVGVAFDGSGNLFVASDDTGAIYKFTPGGIRSTFASGLNGPFSLTFNSAGTLFMGDEGGQVSEFTPSGTQSTFASGLNAPFVTGLAFNSAGDLFVGVSSNGIPGSGYIDKITTNGVVSTFASGLVAPYGMAFNSASFLFVAEFSSGYIYEYAPNGARSTFASGLNHPEGLAFNSAGNLFVSSNGNIYEFTPSGARSTFATNTAGGLALDALAFQPIPQLQGNVTKVGFQLSVTMPSPYQSTIIQVSTDLENWTNLYTNTPPFIVTDSMATTSSRCFYRAVLGH